MRAVAHVLSVALHPLFMPFYMVFLVFQVDPHVAFFLPPEHHWIIFGMVALMTIAFPLTSTFLLLRTGMISSLQMPERSDRIGPYMLTLIYYGMMWYLLQRTPLHWTVSSLFIGVFVALLLTTVITLKWKISAHMVGIGGVLGAVCGLTTLHDLHAFFVISGSILAVGVLGTMRLLITDHTPAQIHTGAALGIVCTYGCLVLEVGS
ncbi:MAG: hypothetical protein KA408_02705 [Flavobacteriales bacterium]|nr:hypothetical protein [Flavobacteriales bacterium]